MRELIAASWKRSLASGLDADKDVAPVVMERSEVVDYRSGHMLARVFPLLYDVLGRAAEDCGCVMAIGDNNGRLLWVVGKPAQIRQADSIRFVEGTDWRESAIGTNAPGTALLIDAAIQVSHREHFNVAFKDWSCSAAPIHHPQTQKILGVVDVTGTGIVDTPQTLAMVRSAARMAEAELGRLLVVEGGRRSPHGLEPQGSPLVELTGLGRPALQVEWNGRSLRLSRRHSDIIAVLAGQPDGISADQLLAETYDEEVQPSTIRAQMTRLRSLLGPGLLDSKPYRLRADVTADWLQVQRHLQENRLAEAMALYLGPLLPISDAPGVGVRRTALELDLTRALMQSRDIDLLTRATRMRWAADNLELWELQARLLPPRSPLLPVALRQVQRLRAEYGIAPIRPNRLQRI